MRTLRQRGLVTVLQTVIAVAMHVVFITDALTKVALGVPQILTAQILSIAVKEVRMITSVGEAVLARNARLIVIVGALEDLVI